MAQELAGKQGHVSETDVEPVWSPLYRSIMRIMQ
jgi:hypothetical protein